MSKEKGKNLSGEEMYNMYKNGLSANEIGQKMGKNQGEKNEEEQETQTNETEEFQEEQESEEVGGNDEEYETEEESEEVDAEEMGETEEIEEESETEENDEEVEEESGEENEEESENIIEKFKKAAGDKEKFNESIKNAIQELPEEEKEDILKNTKHRVKVNGEELEVNYDNLKNNYQKAIDYTKKTQQIAEWKDKIEKMNHYGIEEDDLEEINRLKKGDQEAIKEMLAKSGVDYDKMSETLNNYEEDDYQQKQKEIQEKSQKTQEPQITDRVRKRIKTIQKNDSQLFEKVGEAVQQLPSEVAEDFHQDSDLYNALVIDVKNDAFNAITSRVMANNPNDFGMMSTQEFLSLYQQEAQKMQQNLKTQNNQNKSKKKKKTAKSEEIKEKANQKKGANSTAGKVMKDIEKMTKGKKKGNRLLSEKGYKKWRDKFET